MNKKITINKEMSNDDIINFWLTHTKISDSSIVNKNPNDDVLFVIAGMIKIKHHFENVTDDLNIKHWSNQMCIRVNDLSTIGDTTHLTSFDMLGFFSINNENKLDYMNFIFYLLLNFKNVVSSEQINLFPLLDINEMIDLDINKIHIVLFPYEDEIQKEIMFNNAFSLINDEKRIHFNKNNFWNSGKTGPCGACTEFFYEYNDQLIEIANIVSIENNIVESSNELIYQPIKNNCIDIGIGVERLLTILYQLDSPYELHNMYKTKQYKFQDFNPSYEIRLQQTNFNSHLSFSYLLGIAKNLQFKAFENRKIADHLRTTLRMYESGILPGPKLHNYICRKLIRNIITIFIVNRVGLNSFTKTLNTLTKNDSKHNIIENYIQDCIEPEYNALFLALKKAMKFIYSLQYINRRTLIKIHNTFGVNLALVRFALKNNKHVKFDKIPEVEFDLNINFNFHTLPNTKFIDIEELDTEILSHFINENNSSLALITKTTNITTYGIAVFNNNIKLEIIFTEKIHDKTIHYINIHENFKIETNKIKLINKL